jgi:hypothetical protein
MVLEAAAATTAAGARAASEGMKMGDASVDDDVARLL